MENKGKTPIVLSETVLSGDPLYFFFFIFRPIVTLHLAAEPAIIEANELLFLCKVMVIQKKIDAGRNVRKHPQNTMLLCVYDK